MPERTDQLSIVVCGAGNIGSPLADQLARHPGVARLVIIDLDTYTPENVKGQAISLSDIHRSKAVATAGRANRIAGSRLLAEGILADLIDVPWGVYRQADVVLSCLDSRGDRAVLSAICWRLGRPLIDTGVNADLGLARVTIYLPLGSGPCYLCSIGANEQLEARYHCNGQRLEPPSTNAPASLGTLAACLAMDELARVLDGRTGPDQSGREIVFDLRNSRVTVTSQRPNPGCPFDHEAWVVLEGLVNPSSTLANALDLGSNGSGGDPSSTLVVEGKRFIVAMTCPSCGRTTPWGPFLLGRLGLGRKCRQCQTPLVVTGFDMRDRLDATLPAAVLRRSLRSLGFRAGDVFTVARAAGETHYLIGEPHG